MPPSEVPNEIVGRETMTEHEWPDWVREASRGSLSSTSGKGTWSISEIPA
jgi:hypothetical protein